MIVVDLFAGGGGASEGIRQALGCGPTVAINHDAAAIEMHARNHPGTLHLCEDLLRVQPFRPRRRPIDLLWASPDCTHHSRAKGGKPRETGRRLLAWVVIEWARAVTPRVIILENVIEFEQWGPLDANGKPIKARRGETFREFVNSLRLAGYRVEWRRLNAADYGAPTSRVRLFMVARCDGQPIRWPEPTHGPGRPAPWRTAAECIDWSIPCPSIFERSRELAPATQRRIAHGIRRFVLERPQPFVVCLTHGGRVEPIDEPMRTITCAHRGERALVAPTLVQTSNGEREGQTPRARDITRPLWTVCATGSQGSVVAAFLAKHNGKTTGQAADEPLHTLTTKDTKRVVSAELQPGAADAGNARQVAAFLTKYYGTATGQALDEPLDTVTTRDRFGLVTCTIEGETYTVSDIGMRMLTPRELARAQGFDDRYILTGTKGDQIARIGNSVCPPIARAVAAAQFPSEAETVGARRIA